MKTRLLYEPPRPPRAAFGIASNATCILLPISQVTSLKDLLTPHSFFFISSDHLESSRKQQENRHRLALADRKVREEERNNKLNLSYFLCFILQQYSSRRHFQTLKLYSSFSHRKSTDSSISGGKNCNFVGCFVISIQMLCINFVKS